jgi:hypothetical protein
MDENKSTRYGIAPITWRNRNSAVCRCDTKKNELNTANMNTLKAWRKAPSKGKDPAEYAKECRDCAEQLAGSYGFCGRLRQQRTIYISPLQPATVKQFNI